MAEAKSKVDWQFARNVAEFVVNDTPPPHYDAQQVAADFASMTPQAEELVAAETGLEVESQAKAKVIERIDWVDANLASFGRLMRPLFEKLDAHALDKEAEKLANKSEPKQFSETEFGKMLGPWAEKIDPAVKSATNVAASLGEDIANSVGPKFAGAELGGLLGFMAGRVLGQYDLLVAEDDSPEDQDWVYYVGPNIHALENRFGFPPKEFRLWIAIHECTHRAQFMGVPWLRPYFLSMVDDLINSVDPDPKQLLESLKEARQQSSSDDAIDGGLMMKLASPEQRKVMNRLTGLMSLLEGHGDVVMDSAGKGLIPSQQRFSNIMSQRRKNATGISRVIQKLTGMDAKLAQYEAGEAFIAAVEAKGGRKLFDMVWTSPEALPTLEEVNNPELWIKRVG